MTDLDASWSGVKGDRVSRWREAGWGTCEQKPDGKDLVEKVTFGHGTSALQPVAQLFC